MHMTNPSQARLPDPPGKRDPIALSASYIAAVHKVAAMEANRRGADKSWIYRAEEEMKQYFARVLKA